MRIFRNGALLVLLALTGVPSAFGDDVYAPSQPLEARIKPPSGVASQSRIKPPSGVSPEDPSFFELLIQWLRAQARNLPPIG